jgi:hypothetical protein
MGRRALVVMLLFAAMTATADAHTLTYSKAKAVAQRKGDSVAGKRTRIKSILRLSSHRYTAQAHWSQQNPTGCKGCGVDPTTNQLIDTPTTESCFVDMSIRFAGRRTRRVVARIQSRACF